MVLTCQSHHGGRERPSSQADSGRPTAGADPHCYSLPAVPPRVQAMLGESPETPKALS